MQSETLTEVPLKLMISLKENGAPPSPKELAPYLDALIRRNRIDAAYNAWLQFLPEEQLSNLGLLTNGNFENPPSGLPFDWRMEPGLNAVAGFPGPAADGSGRLLHVTFGPGRVKFPEAKPAPLSGAWTLPPGRKAPGYHYGQARTALAANLRDRLAPRSCRNGHAYG